MTLISIDVGIKNLAYCVFDASNSVIDWNVVNLMNRELPEHKCACLNKKNGVCGKNAKYSKLDQFFCDKHAKSSEFLLPGSLNKLKIDELKKYATDHNVTSVNMSDLKSVILTKIGERMLTKIVYNRTSAGDLDLITIGRNLKTEFDKIEHFKTATHVVIENQISPIATRMKTIQGMIAQYFIMSSDTIKIEFLSSAGKLKGFETQNPDAGTEYAKHKKDAVFYCSRILEQASFAKWAPILETKKKDDLADCFLQGIWYMKRNNINLNA
jgi:hypothetical protein